MAFRTLVRTGTGMVPQITAIKTFDDVRSALRGIITKLNGGISFGDGIISSQCGNLDAQWIDFTFITANTEYEIPWSKNRVPIGYVICRKSAACDIYDSNTGKWSPTSFFLKSSVAGVTVRLMVF